MRKDERGKPPNHSAIINTESGHNNKTNSNEVYPQNVSGSTPQTDKYLYIDGVHSLRCMIDTKKEDIEKEISVVQDKLSRLTKKISNNTEYWYLWEDGGWKSHDRVDLDYGYPDRLKDKIRKLKTDQESTEKEIMSCVIAEIGDGHYIINSTKHVRSYDEAIPLADLSVFLFPDPHPGG